VDENNLSPTDCVAYFVNGSGSVVGGIDNLTNGDELYWRGMANGAPYELDTTDNISFVYIYYQSYTGSVVASNQGGLSSSRPASPQLYQMYYDDNLQHPIWWDGSVWRNATGGIENI
jgi:hypothetical protein